MKIKVVITLVILALTGARVNQQQKTRSLDEAMYSLIVKAGIQFPRVALAQFKLETNNYRSNIFRENKNPAGIKFDKECGAISTNRGHATFGSLAEGVLAYKCIQQRLFKRYRDCKKEVPTSEKEYIDALECLVIPRYGCKCFRYAEDEKYVNKLKKIIHEISNFE